MDSIDSIILYALLAMHICVYFIILCRACITYDADYITHNCIYSNMLIILYRTVLLTIWILLLIHIINIAHLRIHALIIIISSSITIIIIIIITVTVITIVIIIITIIIITIIITLSQLKTQPMNIL